MFYGLSLTWSLDVDVIAFLVLLCCLYVFGLWRLQVRRSHDPQMPALSPWRILAFATGIVVAILLLLTPVNTIGRTQLFMVHMAQVVFLNTICAPCLLFGCSELLLEPLQKIPVVRSILRFLLTPLIASGIFNISFLLWHTPRIYDWAVSSSSSYSAMMICLFVGSILNWWPILGSVRAWKHISYPMQMLYTIFDGLPMDLFAFVLVYTGSPIYSNYHIPAQLTTLTAFGDQATAGALLLLPGVIDVVVLTPLFFRWFRNLEERTRVADERRALEYDEVEYEDEDEEYHNGIGSISPREAY